MILDDRLYRVFLQVFGDKYEGKISIETNMDDIRDWDSMNFINLILGIEEAFGLELSLDEAVEMTQVSTIQETINRKLGEKRSSSSGDKA